MDIPTTEWVAAEVDMDVDVAQEQLQRISAGPQNLTAETFELIQGAYNYVVGHHRVQRTLRRQGVRFEGMRALVKQFIEAIHAIKRRAELRQRFKRRLSQWRVNGLTNDSISILSEYAVMIVDAFSRFVKLTPVKSTSGLDAARALINFVGTSFIRIAINYNDKITRLITEGFSTFQRVTTALHFFERGKRDRRTGE
jgi:hypothetical protein